MVHLLSIDGGFNALPALMMLAEIMERYKFDHPTNSGTENESRPCSIFSMMIGSGHGGLVAILLGKLRMPVDTALEAYCSLLAALPTIPARDDEEKAQNSAILEEKLREILAFEESTPDDLMHANTNKSNKVAVCAVQTVNMANPYYIRSYPSRGAQVAPCTILQAAMACMADPTIYPVVTIGKFHRKVTLVEVPARFANPTKLLLTEAELIHTQDTRIDLILSVGGGSAELLTVEAYQGPPSRLQYGVESEQVHQDLLSRLKAADVYFRFCPRGNFGFSEDPADIQARVSGYLQDVEVSDSVDAVVRLMGSQWRTQAITLGDVGSVRVLDMEPPPRPSIVQNFVGRIDVLQNLRQYHLGEYSLTERRTRISVLAGIGGAGKTQCALKFALEYEQHVPNAAVYFVDARSDETLRQGFQIIAQMSNYGLRRTWSTSILVSKKEWMVILDNADDPSIKVLEYIPQYSSGHVIITTRNSTYANLSSNFQVLESLSTESAVELLLASSGYEETSINKRSALEIVDTLGRLPLAVAHAAGYIRLHQCLNSYIEIYSQSRQQLLRTSTMAMFQDYDLSVASTIQMSLDRLPTSTQFLLHLLAEFNNIEIPFEVFQVAARRRFGPPDLQVNIPADDDMQYERNVLLGALCPEGAWSEAYFNELIEPCLSYSLLRVTRSGQTRMFSMHILVQTWIQSALRTNERQRLFICLLSSSISRQTWAHIHLHRLIAPHIQRILLDQVSWTDKWALAFAMDEAGEFKWSQARLRDVLGYAEAAFGDESPITLAIMTDLATSHDRFGNSSDQEALALHQQVLTARLKLRGENDIETIYAMSNVANALLDLWRHDESRTLYLKVIELLKASEGPDHPEVLKAESRLATILFRDGHRSIGFLAKKSMMWKIGTQHGVGEAEKLRILEKVATSLYILSQYSNALELLQSLARMMFRLVGSKHPTFLRPKILIAGALCNLGRFDEAIKNLEYVLRCLSPPPVEGEYSRRLIDADDRWNTPEGLSAQRLMCFVLLCSGSDMKAVEWHESTVKAHLKTLGVYHPHTVWVQKPLEDWSDPTLIEYAIREPRPGTE